MAKQFQNVHELVQGISKDSRFKQEICTQMNQNGLGKFLFFLRCKHKMTQQELADTIGCSQGRISKIESAKDEMLSIKDFLDYGKAFNLDLEIGFRGQNKVHSNSVGLVWQ